MLIIVVVVPLLRKFRFECRRLQFPRTRSYASLMKRKAGSTTQADPPPSAGVAFGGVICVLEGSKKIRGVLGQKGDFKTKVFFFGQPVRLGLGKYLII